jgi:hypothetical protein
LYGNLATNYTGAVSFSSSDGAASLPTPYTFTSSDAGVHSFPVTLVTAGAQTVTVTGGTITAQQSTNVSPAAPTSLTATAASSSEIDLKWTSAAGATGYLVQRSPNGSSSWAQIGSVAGGSTTTYADTGLTAATTYFYRVIATGGGFNSAASNVASATTTGSGGGGGGGGGSGTTDSIWGASFVPNENAYSFGSFEVGVKFKSDVAGLVTGVRFYEQSWMYGYTHIGHLWSSTGALLATATFTGESRTGWQQVTFASPVSIAANTVYIASFSTGGGYFGITTGYFSSAGVDNAPLHALSNGASGGDGVYHSGVGTFPTTSGSGMNFWADVLFSPSSSPAVVVGGGTSTGGTVSGFTAIAPSGGWSTTGTTTVATPRTVVTFGASFPYRRSITQTSIVTPTRPHAGVVFGR